MWVKLMLKAENHAWQRIMSIMAQRQNITEADDKS